ncbi:2,3-diketo-L-gulonate TRAP transporter small permease protein YiaM [Roseivivax jejudonensis]|uniref:TRAP transporter small permease protein n=1 Tax=Roseivivax jejudonensis TaxID=1529041 RepID=A0A1X6YZV8_9RHOB|nr:TRAP transporter small permease [Roseivivax jejudonensis]SLN34400.1 2,3-diketo-L-gulonate TRAP transporter small permease protein YiaM [Roseivivax jejudonensis]
MKRLERIFVSANGWALILILGAMPLIVGANISLRYLTGHSLSWADEAARYLMIWMTFIGAGLALRMGAHVAITNLQDSLPGPGQKILRGALVVGLLIFFGFMVSVGIEYAQRMQFQLTPALRVPFLYVYAAMPVGFLLLIVHLLLIAPQFVRAGTYKGAAPVQGDAAMREGANG